MHTVMPNETPGSSSIAPGFSSIELAQNGHRRNSMVLIRIFLTWCELGSYGDADQYRQGGETRNA